MLENEKDKILIKSDETRKNSEIELKKSQSAAKEYMNRVSLLEDEIRSSHALTGELRQTATDAEGVCLELKNRVLLMESQSNNMTLDMNNLRSELNQSNSRRSKLEVEIEKVNVAMSSIAADNDALNSIRRNLEDETHYYVRQLPGSLIIISVISRSQKLKKQNKERWLIG